MAKLNTSVTLPFFFAAGGSESLPRHRDEPAFIARTMLPDCRVSATLVSAPVQVLRALCGLALVVGLVQDVKAQSAAVGTPHGPAPSIAPPFRVAPRLQALPRPTDLATIHGSAVDTAKAAVPNAAVRLRDARLGRIVGAQMTDKEGNFTFHRVEPGSYVAEIVDENRSVVVASSQLIGANAGEQAVVVLKLPTSLIQFGRFLGSTTSSNAVLEAQAAAVGGVGAVRPGTPISER